MVCSPAPAFISFITEYSLLIPMGIFLYQDWPLLGQLFMERKKGLSGSNISIGRALLNCLYSATESQSGTSETAYALV